MKFRDASAIFMSDALQLASALVSSEEDPSRLAMICFDVRLSRAAKLEGFQVNPQ